MKDGILPLWKPKGMTSFSAVKKASKLVGNKKAGHTGTLDPDVEGVLPICFGKATKIVSYLTAESKVYVGEVTLGFSTDTEDASGVKLEERNVNEEISLDKIDHIFQSIEGELMQVPPMYSAVKIKGKKLYEYAREGITIDRPARKVIIHSLERLSSPLKHEDETVSFYFRAHCSKGTYIRTLSVLIGEKLGYPSHMSNLVREASGTFKKEACISFQDLEKEADGSGEIPYAISIEEALNTYPIIRVDKEIELKVLQGAILPIPEENLFDHEDTWFIYNDKNQGLALYKRDTKRQGMMKPEKMIRSASDGLSVRGGRHEND